MTSSRTPKVVFALLALVLSGCATTVGGTAAPEATTVATAAAPVAGSIAVPATEPSVPATEPSVPVPPTGPIGSESPVPSSSSAPSSATAASSASSGSGSSGSTAYPTAPVPIPAHPSTESVAHVLEGIRIADKLLDPALIDPSFTTVLGDGGVPMQNTKALTLLFGDPAPAVAQRGGMTAGFFTTRISAGGEGLTVAAFEYPSPTAASAGAKALAAATVAKSYDTGKVGIAALPTAVGWVGRNPQGHYALTFLAQGSMVLFVQVSAASGTDAALKLTAKTLTAQGRSLARFVPTPAAELMELPMDVDGVLSRTLPDLKEQTVFDHVFTVNGYLSYMLDPARSQRVLTAAGVDVIGRGAGTLYRARDAAAAATIRTDFIAQERAADPKRTDLPSPAGLPDVRCLQNTLSSQYYCVGVHGRFAYELFAGDRTVLAEMLTAQEQMLAGA